MGKTRGFKLGRKLVKVFKWCVHRRRTRRRGVYQQLANSAGAMSKLCKWVHSLKHGAKGLSSPRKAPGYIRVGREEPDFQKNPVSVPKGHLAVYLGDKDDDSCRVLVPVIYFNHPLFGELLREAEEAYGFDHPGGIQIPCLKTEFENVQMKIAATSGGGIWWRRRNRGW